MPILSKQQKVYSVRSLEETKQILLSAEIIDLSNMFKRIFIIIWVFAANIFLNILHFCFFKKRDLIEKEFENIVVYTVGIVGDNVVMLPALAALRRRYQTAKITIVTNCQIWDQEGAKSVLEPSPFKDRLIVVDDHPVQRKGLKFLMDSEKFKGIECDLFVNLSPFGNRGWFGAVVREMIFAKKLGAQYAIGFRMSTYSRKGIFNEVQLHFVKNEPRRSKEVLEKLVLLPVENEDLFSHDNSAKNAILKKVIGRGCTPSSLFVMNPGAKFKSKCWPAERFGEVANYVINKYQANVVLTGTNDERNVAEEIVRKTNDKVINLAGETTIQELVELLRIAVGCITNDTGTMHIAAMIRTPTVAIFSTRHSPSHWLSIGGRIISVFSLSDCCYCYDDFCESLECLNKIKVEDVLRSLDDVLKIV